MSNIHTSSELRSAIQLLEIKSAVERIELKEEFKTTLENLRPVNIVKNTFTELLNAPNLKADLLSSVIGIVSGYVSKKIAIGNSHNPIKQFLGNLLQVGITNIVSHNSGSFKNTAINIIQNLLQKKTHHTNNI